MARKVRSGLNHVASNDPCQSRQSVRVSGLHPTPMLKKNWYLFTPLAILGLPALLLCYYVFSFGYPLNEAVESVSYFLKSGTRYAMKYEDRRFSRVRPGMGGREVFELIGVPFERRNNDEEWHYSLPQGSTPYYHERIVKFVRDKNNVPLVKETVKGFHAE